MAQFNNVKMTAWLVDVGCLFFCINHTKLNYILVADKCQSDFVESKFNLITNPTGKDNIRKYG